VFLSFIERHRRYLYSLALRITRNEQDAKDVVQARCSRPICTWTGSNSVRMFARLNRILVNGALDHLRDLRRRPDMHNPKPLADVAISTSPDPERLAPRADWRRHVSAWIR
jgi:DNA-directed RNA polymerase specialized sigma24 family protein